jgi:Ca2+-binding RTX toxin-like protein
MSGTVGAEKLVGGEGSDVLLGLGGADTLLGGLGADTLDGGAEGDELDAGSGNDLLRGGDEADTLTGGDGLDTLEGGAGNDLLRESDYITAEPVRGGLIGGGAGDDRIEIGESPHGSVTIEGGEGFDTLQILAPGFDFGHVRGIERLVYAGWSNTVIELSDDNVEAGGVLEINPGWIGMLSSGLLLLGGAETDGRLVVDTISTPIMSLHGTADTIIGSAGDDLIRTYLGDDRITGGAGADTIDGGDGFDIVTYSGSRAEYDIETTPDGVVVRSLSGPDGTDLLRHVNRLIFADLVLDLELAGATESGTVGAEKLVGGEGSDVLLGLGGADTLLGGLGADTLDGGAEGDELDAGSGNDLLRGGDEADTLTGGDGLDTLEGGAGNDLLRESDYITAEPVRGGLIGGGAGDDRIEIGESPHGSVTIEGGEGFDTLQILAPGFDFGHVRGIERLVYAGWSNTVIELSDDNVEAGGVLEINPGWIGMLSSGLLLLGGAETDGRLVVDTISTPIMSLHGTADTIIGSAGDDLIRTYLGDDRITGGAGADTIDGGDGFDIVTYSGSRAEYDIETTPDGVVVRSLSGPDGTDLLRHVNRLIFADLVLDLELAGATESGTVGAEKLVGGEGSDVLLGLGGADTLLGGLGADTLDGGAEGDELDAGSGNDLLRGGDEADTLTGGDGLDTLEGGAGNDLLRESDYITAEPVRGGLIGGGAGDDRIEIGESPHGSVTIEGGEGFDTLQILAPGFDFGHVRGIERLVYAGWSNTVIELSDDNVEAGGVLEINPGWIGMLSSGLLLLGGAETDGRLVVDTISTPIMSLHGTADTIIGSAGDDLIRTYLGDDRITGGAGADTIDGGDGFDIVTYSGSRAEYGWETVFEAAEGRGHIRVTSLGTGDVEWLYSVNALQFADIIVDLQVPGLLLVGTDLPDDLEGGEDGDIISAGGGDDIVGGGAGIDSLAGGTGGDSLTGDAGDDTIEGGAGADNAFGGEGGDSLTGDAGADTFDGGDGQDSIEGGDQGDSLSGGGGDDLLYSGSGNDTVEGGEGADSLVGGGGAGNDAYVGGAGRDMVIYTSAKIGIKVNLSTSRATGSEIGTDTLVGIEDVVGGAGADALIGTAAANRLDGYSGHDTLNGGLGADSLVGGAGLDMAAYWSATAGVVADLQSGGSGGEADGDRYSGIEQLAGSSFADVLRGSGLANLLEGRAGADQLAGRDGADTMVGDDGDDTLNGGLGADSLVGGAGLDMAAYWSATAGVVADLQSGGSGGEADGDRYSGIEQLAGSSFADVLRGSGLANLLEGRAGADQLAGRDGADTMVGDDGDDTLNGGLGSDSLVGGAGLDMAAYWSATAGVVADLQSGGSGGEADGDRYSGIEQLAGSSFADVLRGSGLANLLEGRAGADQLAGRDGADTMVGDDGDDTLNGGLGADRLIGGRGNDLFEFGPGDAGVGAAKRDMVDGWSAGDLIDISALDADPNLTGDQPFIWNGAAVFSGIGQVLLITETVNGVLQVRLLVNYLGSADDITADAEILILLPDTNLQITSTSCIL